MGDNGEQTRPQRRGGIVAKVTVHRSDTLTGRGLDWQADLVTYTQYDESRLSDSLTVRLWLGR